MQGRVVEWKDERGFGFIEPLDGGATIFFHITAMARRRNRPQVGETLLFEVTTTQEGKLRAIDVRRPERTALGLFSIVRRTVLSLFALLFLAALWRSASQGKLPPYVLWGFTGLSSFTFCVYRVDKWAAKRNFRRVPEFNLQFLAFLGGWPGALLAQQAFRHKCSKRPFQAVFWLMVALNCGSLVCLNLLATTDLQWLSIPKPLKPHKMIIRPRFHGTDEVLETDPRFRPQQDGESWKWLID